MEKFDPKEYRKDLKEKLLTAHEEDKKEGTLDPSVSKVHALYEQEKDTASHERSDIYRRGKYVIEKIMPRIEIPFEDTSIGGTLIAQAKDKLGFSISSLDKDYGFPLNWQQEKHEQNLSRMRRESASEEDIEKLGQLFKEEMSKKDLIFKELRKEYLAAKDKYEGEEHSILEKALNVNDHHIEEMPDLTSKTRKDLETGLIHKKREHFLNNPENKKFESKHVSIVIENGKEAKFIMLEKYSVEKDITWGELMTNPEWRNLLYDLLSNNRKYNLPEEYTTYFTPGDTYLLARTLAGGTGKVRMISLSGIEEHVNIEEEFQQDYTPLLDRPANLDILKFNRMIHDTSEEEWLEKENEICFKKGESVYKVRGGGRAKFREDGTLSFYGDSERFGKFWSGMVTKLMAKEFPEQKISA